ncbi:MAG: enoyl-CoA hydratase-related protein [Bacteroidia bacterium]|jgi:methylglutaconyl-CoA hydratase
MQKDKTKHTDSSSPLFWKGLGEASYRYIEIQLENQSARITLNRPERHNAIVPELLTELDHALTEISAKEELLFVLLSGSGRSFCAGADLNWFSGAEERTQQQNIAQTKQLADVLLKIFQMPQVTIATVRGNVFGGGIGLMAACDFVLAEANTRFMFSEVKRGLLPATILPFVAKRLSAQNLRKWILTGDLFLAPEAHQAGLIDFLLDDGKLESGLNEFMKSFEESSPCAIRNAKQMINQVVSGQIDVTNTDVTAAILAKALLSPDGQEGIQAFLEKRNPNYSLIPNPSPKEKGASAKDSENPII